jgi:hypothetical protein
LSSDFNDQTLAGEITSIQAGENWPMISKHMKRADGIYSEFKAIFEDVPRAKSGFQRIWREPSERRFSRDAVRDWG